MLSKNELKVWMEKFLPLVLEKLKLPHEEDEIEKYLDFRDQDPFDSKWVAAHESNIKAIEKMDETEKFSINEVSGLVNEKVYIFVIKKSGSSELAAYIADDFSLIIETVISGFEESFSYSLMEDYSVGKLPKGENGCMHYNLEK